MLPKHHIQQEYRHFVERRADMTRAYTQQPPPLIDVQCAASVPHAEPPPPPPPVRAPASLSW